MKWYCQENHQSCHNEPWGLDFSTIATIHLHTSKRMANERMRYNARWAVDKLYAALYNCYEKKVTCDAITLRNFVGVSTRRPVIFWLLISGLCVCIINNIVTVIVVIIPNINVDSNARIGECKYAIAFDPLSLVLYKKESLVLIKSVSQ